MVKTDEIPSQAEFAAERCRRSLRTFVADAWPLVEPGTSFVGNWHVDAICEHLEYVSARQIRRLIINVPPRHMKSLASAVFWPCWEWLDRPETKWLFASYAQSLSTRDSLKCRRLIKTEGTRHPDPDRTALEQLGYRGLLRTLHGDDAWSLSADQDAKMRFENTRHGYRLATSVTGGATGEGGDIVVVDDAHKVLEAESDVRREQVSEWFDGTMRSRLNQPKSGAFVVIMQRVHEEDLVGHLLEQGGWEHVCLPAEYEPSHPFVWPSDPRTEEGELLWPERIGPAELDDLKLMGSYRAAGQLQQRPAPAEGLLFKRKHFRRWRVRHDYRGALRYHVYELEQDSGETLHVDGGQCQIFQTADAAASDKTTADFSVVSTWALTPQRQLLLLKVERQRFDVLEVAGFFERENDAHGRPPLWIEEFGAGKGPLKTLRQHGYPAMALQPQQGTQLDKTARAWPAVAAYEGHSIFHPVDDPDEFPWLGEFEHELLSFPYGKNDDQVDTVSYAARLAATMPIGSGSGDRVRASGGDARNQPF